MKKIKLIIDGKKIDAQIKEEYLKKLLKKAGWEKRWRIITACSKKECPECKTELAFIATEIEKAEERGRGEATNVKNWSQGISPDNDFVRMIFIPTGEELLIQKHKTITLTS